MEINSIIDKLKAHQKKPIKDLLMKNNHGFEFDAAVKEKLLLAIREYLAKSFFRHPAVRLADPISIWVAG